MAAPFSRGVVTVVVPDARQSTTGTVNDENV